MVTLGISKELVVTLKHYYEKKPLKNVEMFVF